MKNCPICNSQPLTIKQFVLKANYLRVKCRSCGAQLKGNHIISISFYSALIFGLCGGLLAVLLEKKYGWPQYSGLAAFVILLFAIGIPVELFTWRHGAYIDPKQDKKTAEK